jgi:hypothetical protein
LRSHRRRIVLGRRGNSWALHGNWDSGLKVKIEPVGDDLVVRVVNIAAIHWWLWECCAMCLGGGRESGCQCRRDLETRSVT